MSSNEHIKYAILNFGYVESYRLGSLVLFNQGEAFASAELALKSLAEDLLAMYKEDRGLNKKPKKCCSTNSKKKFCSDCGLPIGSAKIHASDFHDWLISLMERDVDSIGYLEEDIQERDIVWALGISASQVINAAPNEVLVLEEYAERKILEALNMDDF